MGRERREVESGPIGIGSRAVAQWFLDAIPIWVYTIVLHVCKKDDQVHGIELAAKRMKELRGK